MKTVISNYQAALILITVVVSTAIISLPSLMVNFAGKDAWLSAVLITFFGLLFSLVLTFLCRRMGRIDLINYTRLTLGSFLAVPAALLIITTFIFLAGTVVRETSEILVVAYFPQTPLWFINSTLLLTACFLVYYGLETTARALEVIFYLYLGFFLLVMLFLVSEVSISFLKPVLGEGFKPVWQGFYPGLVFFSEIFIILILTPNLTENRKILPVLGGTVLFSGFIISLVIFMTLTIFGPELTDLFTIPLINLSSYIKKLMIVERLDPLFIFYWVGGGLFKTAILFYVAVYTAQKLFNLSTYHIFIPIFFPPIFYISFYFFKNIIELRNFLIKSQPYLLLTLLVLPILILITSLIRGVNVEKEDN